MPSDAALSVATTTARITSRQGEDGAHIESDAKACVETGRQAAPGGAETDSLLEDAASGADQIVARLLSPAVICGSGRPARVTNGRSSAPDRRLRARFSRSCGPAARWRCGRDCGSENPCAAKALSARSRASTRLTDSKNSAQSVSEIRRMLVMTLRTVTFDATCRSCTWCTTSSIVVPCRRSCVSSQPTAGVVVGSWSRRRLAS